MRHSENTLQRWKGHKEPICNLKPSNLYNHSSVRIPVPLPHADPQWAQSNNYNQQRAVNGNGIGNGYDQYEGVYGNGGGGMSLLAHANGGLSVNGNGSKEGSPVDWALKYDDDVAFE